MLWIRSIRVAAYEPLLEEKKALYDRLFSAISQNESTGEDVVELASSDHLENVWDWLDLETESKSAESIAEAMKNALIALMNKMESTVSRYGLPQVSAPPNESKDSLAHDDSSDEKHFFDTKYMEMTENDKKICIAVLQIFYLSCQCRDDNKKLDEIVNCTRMARICISMLFVIDPTVSMYALRVLSYLICSNHYQPPLVFAKHLLAMAVSVPCGNGSGSSKYDKMSMNDYITGNYTKEFIKDYGSEKVTTTPIFSSTTVARYRIFHSLSDFTKRCSLVAQQMYALSTFMVLFGPRGLNTSVSARAPNAIASIIDVCRRPNPSEANYNTTEIRGFIVEGISLMFEFSMHLNRDSAANKWQLILLLSSLKDPQVNESYFCSLVNMICSLSMNFVGPLLPTLLELTEDQQIPLKCREKILSNSLSLILRSPVKEMKEYLSVKLFISMIRGMNLDLECFCAEKNNAEISGSDLRLITILTSRARILHCWVLDCMNDELETAVQNTPAISIIYRALSDPKIVDIISETTCTELAEIGSLLLSSDQARALVPELDLRKWLHQASIVTLGRENIDANSLAIASPLIQALEIVNSATHVSSLSETLDEIDQAEYPTFHAICTNISKSIIDLCSRCIESILLDEFYFDNEELNFGYMNSFTEARNELHRGIETIIIPSALNVFESLLKQDAMIGKASFINIMNLLVCLVHEEYQLPVRIGTTVLTALANSLIMNSEHLFLQRDIPIIRLQSFAGIEKNYINSIDATFGVALLFSAVISRSNKSDIKVEHYESFLQVDPFTVERLIIDRLDSLSSNADEPKSKLASTVKRRLKMYLQNVPPEFASKLSYELILWTMNTLRAETTLKPSELPSQRVNAVCAFLEVYSSIKIDTKTKADLPEDKLPSKTAILDILKFALTPGFPKCIADYCLLIGQMHFKCSDDVSEVNELPEYVQTIAFDLLDLYGIKLVEMSEASWLLGKFPAQNWFQYFVEAGRLKQIVDGSLDAVKFIIKNAERSHLIKEQSFYLNLTKKCAEYTMGSDSEKERHKWLVLTRCLVCKFSTGLGSDRYFDQAKLVYWSSSENGGKFRNEPNKPSNVDISPKEFTPLIDELAVGLYLGAAGGKWNEPIVYDSISHLWLRNLDENFSSWFFEAMRDMPFFEKDCFESLPWNNPFESGLIEGNFDMDTHLNFLKSSMDALSTYSYKVSQNNLTSEEKDELAAGLDGIRTLFLFVVRSVPFNEVIGQVVHEMISVVIQTIHTFEDRRFNGIVKEFLATLYRVVALNDKVNASILKEDILRLSNTDYYQFRGDSSDIFTFSLAVSTLTQSPSLASVLCSCFLNVDGIHLMQLSLFAKHLAKYAEDESIPKAVYERLQRLTVTETKNVETLVNEVSGRDNHAELEYVTNQFIQAFLNSKSVSEASGYCAILMDMLKTTGTLRQILTDSSPSLPKDGIVLYGTLRATENMIAPSDNEQIVFALLMKAMTLKSLDEPYSANNLESIESAAHWISGQISEVLNVDIPAILDEGEGVERAASIFYVCFQIVCEICSQSAEDLNSWASVADGLDKNSKTAASYVMRVLASLGIIDELLKTYALFNTNSYYIESFKPSMMRMLSELAMYDSLKIVSADTYSMMDLQRYEKGYMYEPGSDFNSETDSIQLIDEGSHDDLHHHLHHVHHHHHHDDDSASNDDDDSNASCSSSGSSDLESTSDSEMIDEHADDLRNRHRQRIEASRGNIFRNSVLGDLESDSSDEAELDNHYHHHHHHHHHHGSDMEVDDEGDDEGFSGSDSEDSEMLSGNIYLNEVNVGSDDAEISAESDPQDFRGGEFEITMNSESPSEASSSQDSRSSNEGGHDSSVSEVTDSDASFSGQEVIHIDLNNEVDMGILDELLLRGGDGVVEISQEYAEDEPNSGDDTTEGYLYDSFRTYGLQDDVSEEFVADSAIDPNYWIWSLIISRNTRARELLSERVEDLAMEHAKSPGARTSSRYLSDIHYHEVKIGYVVKVKDPEDPRSLFTPLFLSTLVRFMFDDIFDNEMGYLKSACQWMTLSDEISGSAFSKLFNALRDASRGHIVTLYESLFRESTLELSDCQLDLPESVTPSLVCFNILRLLSLLFSQDKSLLYEGDINDLPLRLKNFVITREQTKLVTSVASTYSKQLIELTCEPLIANNRKLLVAASGFVNQVLKLGLTDSDPKIEVSPHLLTKLVNVLGSKQCSSDAFNSITDIIRRNLNIDDTLHCIVKEACRAKASLLQLFPEFSGLGTNVEMFSRSKNLEMFLMDQIKLLRLFSALENICSDATQSLSALEQMHIFPLWHKVLSHLHILHRLQQVFGSSTLLGLLEIVATPALTVIDCRDRVEDKNSDFIKSVEDFGHNQLPAHKAIINEIIHSRPHLTQGPLGKIAHIFGLLDFQNKCVRIRDEISNLKPRYRLRELKLELDREKVLEESFKGLMHVPEKNLRSPLNITFKGEPGFDAGGVAREWLEILSRALVNPDYALFMPITSGSSTYQINPLSAASPSYMEYFQFTGRVIGRAIWDSRTIGNYFSRAIYKYILGIPVTLNDMEAIDESYYKSLHWMLENDITDIIFETFSVERMEFGEKKTVDLIPNGSHITVTEGNKHNYVQRIVSYRLVDSVEMQLTALKQGIADIVPLHLISIFNEQELELLISGMPDIDIDEWRANTLYGGYTPSSPQVKWFWIAVKSFTTEERAKLLQFCTGTSRVPVQGFGQLESNEGVGKFSIHKERSNTNRLPSSHTCMNQLVLPEYESYKKLRSHLLQAITEGNIGFGFI